jgi:hypothetical protein
MVDPGKGWRVVLPVPREVMGKLGGPAQLGERLRPILEINLDQPGQLAPEVSEKLASAYDELLQHLEAATSQEEHG